MELAVLFLPHQIPAIGAQVPNRGLPVQENLVVLVRQGDGWVSR
jgi:hypothetical protein